MQLRNDRKEKFIEDLKTVVDDSEMQEKILELENKITEMEEEKGNLQLRLVDFEDMTGNYLSFSYILELKCYMC